MRYRVHKLFFAWQTEKEEQWLNEMAAKGMCLVSVGYCRFEFEDCEPGEYKIRIQLLDAPPNRYENRKYIEFVESTGAEHIGSQMRWAFFRKKAAEGEFELFSDNESRIKYISGEIRFVVLMCILNLSMGINNVLIATWNQSLINYLGIVNIVVALAGGIGCIGLVKKRKKMKQESQVFE